MAYRKPLDSRDLIRLLARPLVRFCIRRSIKLQELYEAVKEAFVDCAKEELQRSGHEVNHSRLSVMSGMQRREIAKILEQSDDEKEDPNLLRKIIGQWQGDKRFTSAKGKPRKISLTGKDSEFADLVRSVSQDLNPYTVLFELERIGAVRRSTDGEQLELAVEALSVGNDAARGVRLLAGDVDDITRAVEFNIFEQPAVPHHHIKTHYDNIAVEALPKIREWILEKGASYHKEVREYLARFDKDLNPKAQKGTGGARVAFGSFSLCEEPANSDTKDDDND